MIAPGPPEGDPPGEGPADAPEADTGAAAGPPPPEAAAEPAPRRRWVRDYVETVLVAIVVVLFVTTYVTRNSLIPSGSMEDTLLIGDHVLVDRIVFSPVDAGRPGLLFAQRPIEAGDVVIFKFPADPDQDYVKRVIGLPGDVIEIRDKRVHRNGLALDEPHAVHKTGLVHPREAGSPRGGRDNFGPVLVPRDSFFVMGDNRDYSADSRDWWTVPRSHVTGRAVMVFWSHQPRTARLVPEASSQLERIVQAVAAFVEDVRWSRIGHVIR